MAHGTPVLDYKWTTLCATRNRWVACALILEVPTGSLHVIRVIQTDERAVNEKIEARFLLWPTSGLLVIRSQSVASANGASKFQVPDL
jgi:hypothetical protein